MEKLMGRKAREYPVEFKEAAVRRLLGGESGTALSRELDLKRSVLYRWRDAYRTEGLGGLSRRRGRDVGRRRKSRSIRATSASPSSSDCWANKPPSSIFSD